MALPLVKSLQDCADYHQTVEPFIPQLCALPQRLLDTAGSPASLRQLYVETNPLVSGFAISIALGFVLLIVSEINRNYSQVDRMWSLLPNLYIIHFAVWANVAGLPTNRLNLIAAFSSIWSIRLTYNYWRRGGYEVGSEDYRWAILQKYVPGFVWFIFNVTFISFIQSVLLFAFASLPTYTILVTTQHEPKINPADIFYFVILVALVLSEWISDGQQWNYQTAKYKYRDDGKVRDGYTKAELDRGFNTTGLFAYSRHPNFFAEQTIWFMLYQWACFSTNTLYNWTFAGSAALILLFQGSTWLTELITADKYPEYAEYKKQIPMFLPSIRYLKGYTPPGPKIIKTSDLAKRSEAKKQK
ncbi:DUF1295-domain-containing protein [Sarocladium strictum]